MATQGAERAAHQGWWACGHSGRAVCSAPSPHLALCTSSLHPFLVISLSLTFLNFFREGRRKGERERNIDWFPLTFPQLGTWPTAQACAVTGS